MTDTFEEIGGNALAGPGRARDVLRIGAANLSRENGTQDDGEAYPAEFMPVGDPRPQND